MGSVISKAVRNDWHEWELRALYELERRKVPVYQVFLDMQRAGSARTYNAVKAKAYQLTREGIIHPKALSRQAVGYLDVESTDLHATFGCMLSWAIKARDEQRILQDCIKPAELRASECDRRILLSLVRAMGRFDVLVTFYGTGFDLPFVRSRALKHKIDFPGYGEDHTIDLYYLAKAKLKLPSNRLERVADFLGIPGKTKLEPEVWRLAGTGDKRSLAYVLDHNIQDVILTEKVHKRMEKFSKGVARSI